MIVDASRYAVTTHGSCEIPPRLPAIVGSAVDTIVESSDAISITNISAPNTGRTRTCGLGAAAATLLTRASAENLLPEALGGHSRGSLAGGCSQPEPSEESSHSRESACTKALTSPGGTSSAS